MPQVNCIHLHTMNTPVSNEAAVAAAMVTNRNACCNVESVCQARLSVCSITPTRMARAGGTGEGRGWPVGFIRDSETSNPSTDLALGRQCCYVALEVLAGPTPAVD
jgi:hypothetical protein